MFKYIPTPVIFFFSIYLLNKNNKEKNKTSFQLLIEGNKRYIDNNRKFFTPVLNDVAIVNLNKNINTEHIFDTKCKVYNDYESIDQNTKEQIKILTILDIEENKEKCKEYLNHVIETSEKHDNIKLYYATYNQKNNLVTFRFIP
jgi:hypothetical protein